MGDKRGTRGGRGGMGSEGTQGHTHACTGHMVWSRVKTRPAGKGLRAPRAPAAGHRAHRLLGPAGPRARPLTVRFRPTQLDARPHRGLAPSRHREPRRLQQPHRLVPLRLQRRRRRRRLPLPRLPHPAPASLISPARPPAPLLHSSGAAAARDICPNADSDFAGLVAAGRAASGGHCPITAIVINRYWRRALP